MAFRRRENAHSSTYLNSITSSDLLTATSHSGSCSSHSEVFIRRNPLATAEEDEKDSKSLRLRFVRWRPLVRVTIMRLLSARPTTSERNTSTNGCHENGASTEKPEDIGNNTRPPKSLRNLCKEVLAFAAVAIVLWRYRHKGTSLVQLPMPETAKRVEFTQNRSVATTTPYNDANDKDINENGGGVFFCGYVNDAMAQHLFPDYMKRYVGGLDIDTHEYLSYASLNKRTPNNKDILVYGMHGNCRERTNQFPGKILFVNGEPNGPNMILTTQLPGRQRGEDVYQIGLLPDTDHSVMIFHGAWNMMRLNANVWPTLWDPALKPRNSGKYKGLVYLNRKCYPHREAAVNRISSIMTVFHGGDCKGMAAENPAHPSFKRMENIPAERSWFHNRDAYSEYTFCMAMENSRTQHYLSEKIIMAFLAGCIPVYFGSIEVFDVFNKNAFVFYEISDPLPALKQLQELHTNQTAYHEMLQQPIMAHGNQTVRDYFSVSDQIGGGYLKAKLRKVMGVPT
jgi:Glycosyltransferase family 10 (fucosyltransferase) C-term